MPSEPGRLPDFVIIGAQKAASTALADYLRGHRDVWMPDHEDHHLHDPVFDSEPFEDFVARYSGHTEARVGLKCPDYLGLPEVPERARRVLGEVDLIACLRHPVDRFVSAYYWFVRWGLLPLLPVEEGAPRLLHGEYDDLPLVSQVVDFGRYGLHLRRWLDHFPRERLLVLLQEDLRDQPDAAIARVLDFLGLSVEGARDAEMPTRANSGVYSLTRLRFLQAQTRLLLRWDPAQTYATMRRPEAPLPRLVSRAVPAVDRFVLARAGGNRPPRLSPELRAELVDVYATDVSDLEHLVGRDLASWRR